MSKFELLKGFKKCRKIQYKKQCDIRHSRDEEHKTKKKLIKTLQDHNDWIKSGKTKKKWIDGSRFQETRDPRSNIYTDCQVGDAECLFLQSVWIIILQPQVNLSMSVSL